MADLVGISVRTLHHYDEIGLLKPRKVNAAGYREYFDSHLEVLQQILFFRELGFSLKNIKEIMNSPDFNRDEALRMHKKMLIEKRDRYNQMIETLDKTILYSKGEINMSNKEKFAGFDFSKNLYEQEAREKWGDEVVAQTNKNVMKMSKEKQDQFNEIYRELAKLRHGSPDSIEAQAAIKRWFDFLNTIGNYSLVAFAGLGQMYVADERFAKNIDQFGEGLAAFMCEAMMIFADKNN